METPPFSLFPELLELDTPFEGSPSELDAIFNSFLESCEEHDQQKEFVFIDESSKDHSFRTITQPIVTVNEKWRCYCKEIETSSFSTLYRHVTKLHASGIKAKYQCPIKQCTARAHFPASIIYHLRSHHNEFKICCQTLFPNQEQFKNHKKDCKNIEPRPRNLRHKDNNIVYE
jgi:hypothetical protein